MSANLYYILCILFSLTVLLGISMMSRVKTSVWGNFISAFSIFAGILMTLWYDDISFYGYRYCCRYFHSLSGEND